MTATKAFCEWATHELLKTLRSGRIPRGITPKDIHWPPMFEHFRAALVRADRTVVLKLLERPESVMWGAVMSRSVEGDDVTDALMNAFEREDLWEKRLGLFHHATWRETSPAQRRLLMAWARENGAELIADMKSEFGDPEGPERLSRRLAEEPFRHKRWVYMYALHALPPWECRGRIRSYLSSDDPSVRSAAKDSLRHCATHVTISYQRKDAEHFSGRLHDALACRFGKAAVTRDVASIQFGQEWRKRMEQSIRSSTAVLAVIGPSWRQEIGDPSSVIAWELALAFRCGIPVLAVLMDGIDLPATDALPDALARLHERHAIPIAGDPDFHTGVERLVEALDELAGSERRPAGRRRG